MTIWCLPFGFSFQQALVHPQKICSSPKMSRSSTTGRFSTHGHKLSSLGFPFTTIPPAPTTPHPPQPPTPKKNNMKGSKLPGVAASWWAVCATLFTVLMLLVDGIRSGFTRAITLCIPVASSGYVDACLRSDHREGTPRGREQCV